MGQLLNEETSLSKEGVGEYRPTLKVRGKSINCLDKPTPGMLMSVPEPGEN